MKITRPTSTIGAEIHGVELAQVTDDELLALQWALLEHKVIFFRDQTLDDEAHRAFAARWGEPVAHPVQALFGLEQAVGVVFNDADHPPGDGDGWHTDHSWADYVPDVAILRAVEVPAVGGDTLWSDVGAAHDALSAPLQRMLADLTARHDPGPRFALEMRVRMGDEMADRVIEAFPGEDHPVVAAHPITGRPCIFVNPGYTRSINGLTAAESDALLSMLFAHVGRADFVARWRWEPGSVAIWDEHATLHRGPNDFAPATRELRRFTVGRHTPTRA